MGGIQAAAGSVAWSCGDSWATSVRVPPRWLASDGSTVTSTPCPDGETAVGWFPMWMRGTEPDGVSFAGLRVDSRHGATGFSSPDAASADGYPGLGTANSDGTRYAV